MLRYFSRTPSYDEVALICGVPMGTVRSRLSQVNVKLGQALLDTAAAAHHDAAALTASRRRHFTQAFAEYNDAIGCDLYVEACTADVEIGAAGTPAPSRGRAAVAAELEGDIEAGVRFGLDQVIAGAGVTILEGRFINPTWDPFHCPPQTTHVYRHDGDAINSIRLYFGPRPAAC
jgi:RNA polymerase sigma-70 factor (ECF subfamily)